MKLFPQLQEFVESLDLSSIPQERKQLLQELIDYIKNKRVKAEEVDLNFICTHNSRRSQFSQIWAKTAAAFYGVEVKAFSGGVEVTAFNDRAVAALKRAGFKIISKEGNNPKYELSYSATAPALKMFSKLYDDPANALKSFAAVMTCSHADENCPLIPGARKRIALNYEDPKDFDNSPEEEEKYDERSRQIAVEMFYTFSKI